MRVDIYWNITRNRLSVRSRERKDYGKVIGWRDEVYLKNCEFVVGQKGRARVLRSKQKKCPRSCAR